MVRLGGEKMSKSLGNLVFVSVLRLSGTDPMAIRLSILAHHYRTDWDWTATGWPRRRAAGPVASSSSHRPGGVPSAEDVLADVRARLADDLDAPGALAAVDAWADAVLTRPDPGTGAPAAAAASWSATR